MADYIVFKSTYFQAPNGVFELPLTNNEKLVMLYLLRCANNSECAFPSYATIGKKCSFTRMTAIRMVDSLLEKGYLIKTVRPKKNMNHTSNIYEIVFPSNIMLPPPSNTMLPPSNIMLPYKEPLIKDHNNNDMAEKLSTRAKAFMAYQKEVNS